MLALLIGIALLALVSEAAGGVVIGIALLILGILGVTERAGGGGGGPFIDGGAGGGDGAGGAT